MQVLKFDYGYDVSKTFLRCRAVIDLGANTICGQKTKQSNAVRAALETFYAAPGTDQETF